MTGARAAILVAGALAVGLLASTAVFQLDAGQAAVVDRLDRPVRVVGRPGLHLVWPLAERAVRVDLGAQALEGGSRAVRCADGRQVAVDARLLYRVVDPLRFEATLGGASGDATRLQGALADAVAGALAPVRAEDIVADRVQPALAGALQDVRRRTAGLGIAPRRVEIASAALSDADAQAVYGRMRALAARREADVRADGRRERDALLATADRQVGAVRGEAEGRALRIRGEGDARRIAIMGAAYARDPDFARYFRQIEAYENSFTQGDATVVLSPDNAFLRTFARGAAK